MGRDAHEISVFSGGFVGRERCLFRKRGQLKLSQALLSNALIKEDRLGSFAKNPVFVGLAQEVDSILNQGD